MDAAIRNVTEFADWTLQQAVKAATVNPARAAGLEQQGQLQRGAPANIVVLSPAGEVRKTFAWGRAC
jgi:N-acetylglucosamine-6-phosphate deacetylase